VNLSPKSAACSGEGFAKYNSKENKGTIMKKLIATSVCALALCGAASGQSTLNWASIHVPWMTAQTNSTAYSPLQGGGISGGGSQGAMASASSGLVYYFELLYTPYTGTQLATPVSLSELNSWQETGLMATNGNIPGRLTPIAGSTAATVPWTVGVTNNIMMVGWSANLGSTWSEASALLNNWSSSAGALIDTAYFGMSTTGYIAAGDANPGVPVFGPAPTSFGLPIFSPNTQLYALSLDDLIVSVPEPGTLALLGLGGALLLIRHRRKHS
jgi:hypothetical protein